MWDLPGPGLERVSPALAGGLLTTAPPGKPGKIFLKHVTALGDGIVVGSFDYSYFVDCIGMFRFLVPASWICTAVDLHCCC